MIESTGSTNADLAAQALAGAPDGTVLVARHQTAGRGRFDRRWEAPPGAALATSVLVRTDRPMIDWTWLPLVTGVAVLRGIRAVAPGAELELKWPNDVLVTGERAPGKLCGILCERHETPTGPVAIIGFGLNTTLTREQLPVPTATSLTLAGIDADPMEVLAAILEELDGLLTSWEQRGHVREAYTQACGSIGTALTVHVSETDRVRGVGESIDETGRLVVRTEGGLRTFSAGDVVHLR